MAKSSCWKVPVKSNYGWIFQCVPMDKIFHAINKSKTDQAIRNWAGGIAQCCRKSTQPGLTPQYSERKGGRKEGKSKKLFLNLQQRSCKGRWPCTSGHCWSAIWSVVMCIHVCLHVCTYGHHVHIWCLRTGGEHSIFWNWSYLTNKGTCTLKLTVTQELFFIK